MRVVRAHEDELRSRPRGARPPSSVPRRRRGRGRPRAAPTGRCRNAAPRKSCSSLAPSPLGEGRGEGLRARRTAATMFT
jgi:hypothetical protein